MTIFACRPNLPRTPQLQDALLAASRNADEALA